MIVRHTKDLINPEKVGLRPGQPSSSLNTLVVFINTIRIHCILIFILIIVVVVGVIG